MPVAVALCDADWCIIEERLTRGILGIFVVGTGFKDDLVKNELVSDAWLLKRGRSIDAHACVLGNVDSNVDFSSKKAGCYERTCILIHKLGLKNG